MQISEPQAQAIARRLFPDLFSDGSDCKAEIGREGLPCRACAEKNLTWLQCVADVKLAIEQELRFATDEKER